MIRAVIFDMDGLMLDTERTSGEFQRQASEERGIPYQGLKPLVMGRAVPEVRRIHLEHYGPDYPFDEIRARADQLWEQYLVGNPVPVKPGLFPLLEYLDRRDIPAAVATSTSRDMALKLLDKAGIAPYLTAMVFGDMVERSKPEPDIFLRAAELLGAAPRDCMVLEDSPNGIRAAHRAGMLPVMVPDLIQPDEELQKILYRRLERLDQVIIMMEGMEDS